MSRDRGFAVSKPGLLLIFTILLLIVPAPSAQFHDHKEIKCSNGTGVQPRSKIIQDPQIIGTICNVQGSDITGRKMKDALGEVDCLHCCENYVWNGKAETCVKCPEGTASKAGPYTDCIHIDSVESTTTQSPSVFSTQSTPVVNSTPTEKGVALYTGASTSGYDVSQEMWSSEKPETGRSTNQATKNGDSAGGKMSGIGNADPATMHVVVPVVIIASIAVGNCVLKCCEKREHQSDLKSASTESDDNLLVVETSSGSEELLNGED